MTEPCLASGYGPVLPNAKTVELIGVALLPAG